jgi:hypothetical protein
MRVVPALLIIGLTAGSAFAQAPAQSAVERGKYLVSVMDCHGCHTPFKNGAPDMTRMLMGHPQTMKIAAPPQTPAGWGMVVAETNTAWSGPWGVSFTTNLTPDPTGIGGWTEEMFVNAIRKGKHQGTGREILPPMPWASYGNLTDADLKAIFAFLKSIPKIANVVPAPLPPAKK